MRVRTGIRNLWGYCPTWRQEKWLMVRAMSHRLLEICFRLENPKDLPSSLWQELAGWPGRKREALHSFSWGQCSAHPEDVFSFFRCCDVPTPSLLQKKSAFQNTAMTCHLSVNYHYLQCISFSVPEFSGMDGKPGTAPSATWYRICGASHCANTGL